MVSRRLLPLRTRGLSSLALADVMSVFGWMPELLTHGSCLRVEELLKGEAVTLHYWVICAVAILRYEHTAHVAEAPMRDQVPAVRTGNGRVQMQEFPKVFTGRPGLLNSVMSGPRTARTPSNGPVTPSASQLPLGTIDGPRPEAHVLEFASRLALRQVLHDLCHNSRDGHVSASLPFSAVIECSECCPLDSACQRWRSNRP